MPINSQGYIYLRLSKALLGLANIITGIGVATFSHTSFIPSREGYKKVQPFDHTLILYHNYFTLK